LAVRVGLVDQVRRDIAVAVEITRNADWPLAEEKLAKTFEE
jgi:hypothetical protein